MGGATTQGHTDALAAPQVRMVNDIARQFAFLGHDRAVAATTHHLATFWDPRMRDQLRRHAAAGGEGLDPLALEVAEGLR